MSSDVFGKVRLAHLVVESNRLSDWRRFLHDAVGAHVDDLDTGRLAFRMDEHRCRFLVTRGPAEDVAALGWQVDDEGVLEVVHDRLRRQGIIVSEAPEEQAALRGVDRMITCAGPKGMTFELYVDAKPADDPLVMQTSAFVTSPELGMGHVAVTSKHPESLLGFAQRTFGARISDYIDAHINGLDLEITFLRVNARHHSMAVAQTKKVRLDPIRTRIQHVNVEVATLDDLTDAYVRCRQLGFRIALGVGMHTNDRDVSFYAVTPSGFEFEVGWNPITVDESGWTPMRHQGISIWGHKPLDMTLADKLAQAVTGVRSLRTHEDQVPALSGLAW